LEAILGGMTASLGGKQWVDGRGL